MDAQPARTHKVRKEEKISQGSWELERIHQAERLVGEGKMGLGGRCNTRAPESGREEYSAWVGGGEIRTGYRDRITSDPTHTDETPTILDSLLQPTAMNLIHCQSN